MYDMHTISTNNNGEKVVDPYDHKGSHEKWLKSIDYPNATNYFSLKAISSESSELLTKYVLDLSVGKNIAHGSKRGQRSYIHLCNVRLRLRKIIEIFEKQTQKKFIELTEDDMFRAKEELQKITTETNDNLEAIFEKKEREVLG